MTPSPPSPTVGGPRGEMEGADGRVERQRGGEIKRERERESKLQCEPGGHEETEGAMEGEDS